MQAQAFITKLSNAIKPNVQLNEKAVVMPSNVPLNQMNESHSKDQSSLSINNNVYLNNKEDIDIAVVSENPIPQTIQQVSTTAKLKQRERKIKPRLLQLQCIKNN